METNINYRHLLNLAKSGSIDQIDASAHTFAPDRRSARRKTRRRRGIDKCFEDEDAILDLLDEYSYKLDIEKEIRR